MNFNKFIGVLLVIFLISSCNKEDPASTDTNESFNNGILVLNEGLFQQNNSTLSWIDQANDEVIANIFQTINGRALGDTGNDLKRYGGKIYVVMNGSSTVEVISASTLKSIKQIALQHNGQAQQPRKIAFRNSKAYVTTFDGFVNVIDTTSLTVENRIGVGQNPEGLAIFGDQLFVCNSGGLNFPDVDSTVFQIDLNTNVVTDTFVVGANPGDIKVSNSGIVYAVKRGDYNANPSELVRIDPISGSVENLGIAASVLHKNEADLFISYYDYNTQQSNVSHFDMEQEVMVTQSMIESQEVQTLYGTHYLTGFGLAYFDAMSFTNQGYLKIINENGSLKQTYSVGLNPNSVVHYE